MKLNEIKGDRELEQEIKKERRHFFVGRTIEHENFVAAVTE